MAEWLKAPAWKACILLKVSRVRIPFSPPNERKIMNKIYDCVTYFNENLQLELRFNILNKYVNKFIVCEAKQDHKGKKKNINFNIRNKNERKEKLEPIGMFLDHLGRRNHQKICTGDGG